MGPRHVSLSGRYTTKPLKLYDQWLIFSVLGIVVIGLMMVASSSIVISVQQFKWPFHYLVRQSAYLAVGLVVSIFVVRIPSDVWQRISPFLLIGVVGLLVAVLVPGIARPVNGSYRWINLGFINVQVSELAKLSMVLYIAGYLVRRHEEVQNHFSGFLKPMLVLSVVAVLLLKEPDFGAVVVITLTVLAMLFLAGVSLWQFAVLAFMAVVAIGVLAVSSPYRLARLTAFLNPWANQFDGGYQLTQSLIAFGRGGITGVGLGGSVQKLFYLPEAHTDFLFAVLAEELGLLGILVVLGLYTLLIARGLIIARTALRCGRLFQSYVAYGCSLWLSLQTLINIGVNAGLLPTKGLTLPLMSSGGSSMLISLLIIAILLRIDHENRWHLVGFSQ